MSFDENLTACAAIVEKGDPDRFAAAMASPVAARRILFPLYAFNVEVSRAPWVTQEPMIAEMRLQWWRDALEEIAKGQTVRRHEVVTSLGSFLDEEGANALDRLVAARRWDIYKEPFEDETHFKDYLNQTATTLMWASVRALHDGPAPLNSGAEQMVRDLGYATGLARYLQAVPTLEAQNRIPLVDGRPQAIKALAQAALDRLPSRRVLRKTVGSPARSALAEGCLTRFILKQVVANPKRVAQGALGITPLRRSGLLWLWS